MALKFRARPLDPSDRYAIRNKATGEYFMMRCGEPLRPEFGPLGAAATFSRPFAEKMMHVCLRDDATLRLALRKV